MVKFVIRKDVYEELIQKGYGRKDYSKLTTIVKPDKNGVMRTIYINPNKLKKDDEKNEKMKDNKTMDYNSVSISVDDLKEAVQDLKLPDFNELLNSFSKYSSEGKSDKELWTDLKRLAVLNLQANKGYGKYSSSNDEIYAIKDKVIKQIIKRNPKSIKIKTNVSPESNTMPSIIYFENGNKQISFHVPFPSKREDVLNSYDNKDGTYYDRNGEEHYKEKKTDENTIFWEDLKTVQNNQETVGEWDRKPGSYLIDDYSKIKELAKIKKQTKTLAQKNEKMFEEEKTKYYKKFDTVDILTKMYNPRSYGGGYLHEGETVPEKYKEAILSSINYSVENGKDWKVRELQEKMDGVKSSTAKKKYLLLLEDAKKESEEEKNNAKEKLKKVQNLFRRHDELAKEYEGFSEKFFSEELQNIRKQLNNLEEKRKQIKEEIFNDFSFIKKSV